MAQSRINPYKVGRNELSITHLFYADDVLLFTNGTEQSLRNLRFLLQEHENSSGQLISQAKSAFYLHDKYQRRSSVIARVMGLRRQPFPFIYLGVPIFYGRVKNIYFEPLVDKVRRTLEGWKAKLLLFGGRITLIKSVLLSYPIYALASAAIPKSILCRIERLMVHFLWGVQGEARTHWVSWGLVCTPISEGGLVIRRLNNIAKGLNAKLLWLAIILSMDHRRWPEAFLAKNWLGYTLVGPRPVDAKLTVAQGRRVIGFGSV